MTTGFKMVRIPDELAERITAKGHKREPFVRQAVEAALAGKAPTPPAPPRASVAHIGREEHPPVERIGCEEHPAAGALRGGNGRWWCGEADCTNRAREVVE